MEVCLRRIFALLLILSSARLVSAEGTRTWKQSTFDELSKGTAKGVAIRSNGGLELAPSFKALVTTPSTHIWAIASDPSGIVYAAAGSPARVYRVTPDGQATPIFEPQELQVQSLLVAKNGAIYAATNPDGKVYRIEQKSSSQKEPAKATEGKATGSWSSSVYFDPHTKYIWDLAEGNGGNLYVATGDKGEIFRVAPGGGSSVFFKSDEAHIRALAIDPQDNLIAGSDGSGLVYRITPSGEGFVLYSAPKKEITALTVDKSGNIYAAGAGEKHAPPSSNFPPAPALGPGIGTPVMGPGQQPGGTISVGPAPATTFVPRLTGPGAAAGGSEIYRISADGSPARIWSSRDDLVYALAFDTHGTLLAGTGNDGNIFAVLGEDRYVDLTEASATQVTAFAKASHGGLYVSTSNLGKVFLLSSGPEGEGSYESDVFDAQIFSRWGRLAFHGGGTVDLFTRSGNVDNPDRHWSPWAKVDLQKDAPITSPPARFVQWKAVLHTGAAAPHLDSVILNYLPKNVPPDFDDVSVQPGVRYQPLPRPSNDISITVTGGIGQSQPKFEPQPPTTRDADSIGVKWSVHDDNDDQMLYSVYYHGDGEARWLLLKDNLTDKFYSFDASLLPDGGYVLKIVASDVASHSPGEALTSERESARFEVDTTPPVIEGLTTSLEAGQAHVSFTAIDSFSPIARAEYSVDAGEWRYIEPVGQLSDSKKESYDFRAAIVVPRVIPVPALKEAPADSNLEHVVVVRAYDRYDNMAAAKTVIRVK